MKKTMIVASFLALAPFAKGQLLLEALEGGIPFTPSEKCLERVYDKHYGDGVHNYIYCAVQGPNGKKWLNLNLGAEYAKESSPHFNPEALPTDYNDWKAFGNLYQWGRGSDGHEQVEYRQGSQRWEFRPINGIRSTKLAEGESSNQMVSVTNSNLYTVGPLEERWVNDPCPNGYHIATVEDIKGLGALDIIQGTLVTSSLFGNTKYPRLLVMTSPGNQILSHIIEGWNESDAGVRPDTGATSSIWTIGKTQHSLVYDKGVWNERKLYDNPSTGIITFLDRGHFAVNQLGDHTGEKFEYSIGSTVPTQDSTPLMAFGFGTFVPDAKAIRCVQN